MDGLRETASGRKRTELVETRRGSEKEKKREEARCLKIS